MASTKDSSSKNDKASVDTGAQVKDTSRGKDESFFPNDEARKRNFESARETARVNHERDVEQNTVGGYEGVEVRDAQAKEVINPVRNPATGELEDDTRTLKQSPEEQVGADESAKDK